MEELTTTGTLHRFVPNVKFSRLQRSLKKIHSEELCSGINPSITLVGACNFSKKNAQRATWTLGQNIHSEGKVVF